MSSRVRAALGDVLRGVATLLPDALLVRTLPASFRWDPAQLALAIAPDAPTRAYFAPANSAGQAFRWARAAERHLPGVGAVDLMATTSASDAYGFETDVAVPAGAFVFASGWRRRQRRELLGFSHALIESGRFAYGSVPFSTPRRVARRLRRDGVAVALLWHGSDIRLPSAHAAAEPDSPFGATGEYPPDSVAVLERNARAHRRLIDETDFPVYVSTPGLLDVPRSRWLPVVVEMDRWATDAPVLERERAVVAFVPSNSPMKAGATVDAQLAALEEEGLIEYRRLVGVPSASMPEVYRGADIVLDQFRLGDYGVAACEAMAAGRIVVGHVSDVVRARVAAETGIELPVVQSRAADLGAVIRGILADREYWRTRARAGVGFVSAVHDGRRSAAALSTFLGTGVPVVQPEEDGRE